jgi:hypothetical protein
VFFAKAPENIKYVDRIQALIRYVNTFSFLFASFPVNFSLLRGRLERVKLPNEVKHWRRRHMVRM